MVTHYNACFFRDGQKPKPLGGGVRSCGSLEGEVVRLGEGRLLAVDDQVDDAGAFEHDSSLVVGGLTTTLVFDASKNRNPC